MKLVQKNKRAFTLLELLITIAIIGILSSIVLVSLNNGRTKAKIANTKSEMNQIIKAIGVAQQATGKPLKDITLTGCSACSCWAATGGHTTADAACINSWNTALSRIQAATGLSAIDLTPYQQDSWGRPYCLDENELESGSCSSSIDRLTSAGPDGICGAPGNADDISLNIPHAICP